MDDLGKKIKDKVHETIIGQDEILELLLFLYGLCLDLFPLTNQDR